MKQTLLITLILILGLLTLSYAQGPISFRSNAMGGIVDDDLDLIYDPIELRFVDGIRLYTNLSNLTSSEEQLFEDISDDAFLFGISAHNPFFNSLWHSALFRFQNSETSNPVGIDSDLNGYNDLWGNGTLIDEHTAYLDTDFDGSYDLKQIYSQEESDFITDDSYDFILNNTFNLWGSTLGAKLSLGNYTSTENTASLPLGMGYGVLSSVYGGDPTFSRSVSTYQIEEEYEDLTWSEDGDFNTEDEYEYQSIAASLMLPEFSGFELRGDISFFFDETISDINDDYSGQYEYFDPEISDYSDKYSETDSYMSTTNKDGRGFYLGASLRKTFNKQDERKNDGYWKVGGTLGFNSYDYTNSTFNNFYSEEIYFDGMDTLGTDFTSDITQENSTTDEGTEDFLSYKFYYRLNMPLGEKAHFGIGGFLYHSSLNRETDYTESFSEVEDYLKNDNIANSDDYTITGTSSLTADRTYEIFTTSITVPVGVEYRFTNNMKWALRFGSIFTFVDQTFNDKIQTTYPEPYITQTVHGDGDIDIEIDDNIWDSTSEQTKTTTSATVFTYGLGYNPTENLQIDLLGFLGTDDNSILDADFYRSLRLSFSFRF